MPLTIESYFANQEKWRAELELLRNIILDCGLNEELKWAIPVYTYKGKNIVGINGLKNFCSLAFFKGALLQDTEAILYQPGKVQAARWIKFTSTKEIIKLESILKAYIFEAIEIEKAGLKVEKQKPSDIPVPIELKKRFKDSPTFKKSFYKLTPSRQRGYLIYFSDAKQTKTREARIDKYIKHILNGKGITDL